MFRNLLIIVTCATTLDFNNQVTASRPHIILIIADDLGWNDVGFHGSNEIPTPNIDALAYRGVIMNKYYTPSLCTPSRSALLTGKYPIHIGMQHYVLLNNEPRGLPLSEYLLPEYLKDLGYSTHAVGKWHLGFFKKEYTPEYRGFDSHFGHWTGQTDYFDHTGTFRGLWGMDMHRGLEPSWGTHGKYSTELYTEEALNVINGHKRKIEYMEQEYSKQNIDEPLFLYLSHNAVHSANPYQPLQAPDERVETFSYIKHYKRRKYAAMVSLLDESIGKVVESLAMNGMLNNSIIIVVTDNGGAPAGFNHNVASNWPLRGGKFALWEGGTRGTALIWSPLLKKMGRVTEESIHVTDWVPTLLSIAEGPGESPHGLDGYDMWGVLSEEAPSNRKEVLVNIDSIENESALIVGDWKIMIGTSTRYNGTWDDWYGPSGLDKSYEYDADLILNSRVSNAMNSIGYHLNESQISSLREKAKVTCDADNYALENLVYGTDLLLGPPIPCDIRMQICLFNLKTDPCEKRNLAELYPTILSSLLHILEKYNETAIPPANVPTVPCADPALWGYMWTNFGDKGASEVLCSKA